MPKHHFKQLVFAAAACLLTLSCRDLLSGEREGVEGTSAGSGHTLATLECTAEVQSRVVTCSSVSSRPHPLEAHAAVLTNGQITMASTNVSFDSTTRIFRADCTVRNLLTSPIGTTDGTTVTGIKIFFSSGPRATSFASGDTGTVTVANADGYGTFTAVGQPYFLYQSLLQTNAISSPKTWNWHLGPSVKTFTFQVMVFAATPSDIPVPAVAPSGFSISADSATRLYADTNMVFDHPRMAGPYPKNILLVKFRDDAGQESKQAALDLVGGRVIGGWPPMYRVLISDSSAEALWTAIDRLSALPQVARATPDVVASIIPMFRRPNDGSGWHRQDWALNPDSASGANWGAEAIGAPWAWGCSVGSDSVRVAVVDRLATHSQWVSSIIGAGADDGNTIAGLMWKGTVAVTDASRGNDSTPIATVTTNLSGDLGNAVASADIVNLSLGKSYTTAGGALRKPVNGSADSAAAQAFASNYADAIWSFESTSGRHPLYVIAAGNYQMDARYAGLPLLIQDPRLADRVIVVAATVRSHDSATQWKLWANSGNAVFPGSDTGSVVTIAAPGGSIDVVANGSQASPSPSGTSLAAPQVAGVAGLLKSFDPRLTSAELKTILLSAAVEGGRTGGRYPFLDAYQTLKSAARRAGAPLCGNRIWANDGKVFAERALGAAPEQLTTLSGRVSNLDVTHGGSWIDYNSVSDRVEYIDSTAVYWPGGSPDTVLADTVVPGSMERVDPYSPHWTLNPQTRPLTLVASGTANSTRGYSHDRDTAADAQIDSRWVGVLDVPDGQENITLFLNTPNRSATIPIHTYTIGHALVRPGQCWPAGNCAPEMDSTPPLELTRSVAVAYAPRGNLILLALARYTATEDTLRIVDARNGSLYALARYTWTPSRTDLFRVDLPSHTVTPISSDAFVGRAVFSIGISEDGREVVIASGTDVQREYWRDYHTSPWHRSLTSCKIEYMDLSFTAVHATINTLDACPDLANTYVGPRQGMGGGTIAPDKSHAGYDMLRKITGGPVPPVVSQHHPDRSRDQMMVRRKIPPTR